MDSEIPDRRYSRFKSIRRLDDTVKERSRRGSSASLHTFTNVRSAAEGSPSNHCSQWGVAMSESSQKTMSVRGQNAPKLNEDGPSEVSTRQSIPRPSLAAFASLLVLFVGWGAWHFYSTLKNHADGDVSAELDGIELVAPLFEPASPDATTKSGLGDPEHVAATTGRSRRNSADSASTASPATNQNSSHRDVWLTGTIEFDDTDERIAIPQRISGSPSDSSTRR